MRLLLVGIVILTGVGFTSLARADCAPQPSVCYCPDAVAVIDGHVETSGDPVVVSIDAVTRDSADVLPAVVPGETISVQPVYLTPLATGDRVVFGIDGGAVLVGHIFPVSGSETVSCSMTFGHEASVTEATGWLLSEAGQCRAALEDKGWMAPCDDTRESCGIASVPGEGDGWALLVFAAALGWARRRR